MNAIISQNTTPIAEREADILGHPPRIAPLATEEIAPEVRAVIDDCVRAAGREPPPHPTEHTAIMVRNSALYEVHTALGLQLYRGALPVRWREIAILRIAWMTQSPYEWGEHVAVGKLLGGLTGEDVERMRHGTSAPGWDEADRAVAAAVEELLAHAMISDATWAVLERHLDAAQLIELPILVGQYLGVAYMQNSLRVPLPGNPGLSAS